MGDSRNLVGKYLSGDTVEKNLTVKLNDDYMFVFKLMKYSGSKEYYKLSTNRVKKNSDFVRLIIKEYKNDLTFTRDVVKYYLENTERYSLERLEIIIMMSNLEGNEEIVEDYKLMKEKALRIINRNAKSEMECFGGAHSKFTYISKKIGKSDIVLFTVAKKYIEEKYLQPENILEEKLHSSFNSFESFEKYGINTWFIDDLFFTDELLSSYVMAHLKVLLEVKRCLPKIKDNWDNYVANLNVQKQDMIYQYIGEYIDKSKSCNFNCYTVLYQVVVSLGLEKVFEFDEMDLTFAVDSTDNKYTDNKIVTVSFAENEFRTSLTLLLKTMFKSDIPTSELSNPLLVKTKRLVKSQIIFLANQDT